MSALFLLGVLTPIALAQPAGTPAAAQKEGAKREKALESKDAGKLFGEPAWKRVAPAAEKLFKEKGLDLVVETYDVLPKGDATKIGAMKPVERERFFKQLADARAKELSLQGVYVLVTKTPATLYVEVTNPKEFPPGLATKLKSALLASFKEKKYDDGLTKIIDMTLEAKGLGEKK
ncbi:MAG TPA: hypothetical protein VGE74_04630 [Gemmata sp.]